MGTVAIELQPAAFSLYFLTEDNVIACRVYWASDRILAAIFLDDGAGRHASTVGAEPLHLFTKQPWQYRRTPQILNWTPTRMGAWIHYPNHSV